MSSTVHVQQQQPISAPLPPSMPNHDCTVVVADLSFTDLGSGEGLPCITAAASGGIRPGLAASPNAASRIAASCSVSVVMDPPI